MKYISWILVASISLFLFACSAKLEQNSSEGIPNDISALNLPATFTGEIPCEDCLRVELTLNLRPDSLYQLRKNYFTSGGSSKVESQMGYWRLAEAGGFIIFGKGKGALKSYKIIDNNLLRFVGLQGVEAKEQIQYDLTRRDGVDLFNDSVKMRGMMVHGSDESQIKECTSGQTFYLTGGVEYRRMVQTYLNSDHGHMEPVLVAIQGKLQQNLGGEEQVFVDHFKKLYNSIDCEGNRTRANLTKTFWRLTEINGQEIVFEENKKRPFFVLDGSTKEIRGHGSCNEFDGTYLARGEVFLVKRKIETRLACTSGVATESAFFNALDGAEQYSITGDVLKLMDEDGTVMATFLADY